MAVNQSDIIITLNNDLKPIKTSVAGYSSDAYTSYTYDSAGNIATITNSYGPGNYTTKTYRYDTSNSWLSGINGNFYIATGDNELVNNMMSCSTYNNSDKTTSVETYTNYKYDSEGMPLSRLVSYPKFYLQYTQSFSYITQ